jgi:hypothetical protein
MHVEFEVLTAVDESSVFWDITEYAPLCPRRQNSLILMYVCEFNIYIIMRSFITSHSIIRMIKSRRMRLAGHVAEWGEEE